LNDEQMGAAAAPVADGAKGTLRADDDKAKQESGVGSARRYLPIAVILLGIAAFFAFDLDSYITFESIQRNREWLLAQVRGSSLAPLMVWAERCDNGDAVRALRQGADDYMDGAVEEEELAARVVAHLRRAQWRVSERVV